MFSSGQQKYPVIFRFHSAFGIYSSNSRKGKLYPSHTLYHPLQILQTRAKILLLLTSSCGKKKKWLTNGFLPQSVIAHLVSAEGRWNSYWHLQLLFKYSGQRTHVCSDLLQLVMLSWYSTLHRAFTWNEKDRLKTGHEDNQASIDKNREHWRNFRYCVSYIN